MIGHYSMNLKIFFLLFIIIFFLCVFAFVHEEGGRHKKKIRNARTTPPRCTLSHAPPKKTTGPFKVKKNKKPPTRLPSPPKKKKKEMETKLSEAIQNFTTERKNVITIVKAEDTNNNLEDDVKNSWKAYEAARQTLKTTLENVQRTPPHESLILSLETYVISRDDKVDISPGYNASVIQRLKNMFLRTRQNRGEKDPKIDFQLTFDEDSIFGKNNGNNKLNLSTIKQEFQSLPLELKKEFDNLHSGENEQSKFSTVRKINRSLRNLYDKITPQFVFFPQDLKNDETKILGPNIRNYITYAGTLFLYHQNNSSRKTTETIEDEVSSVIQFVRSVTDVELVELWSYGLEGPPMKARCELFTTVFYRLLGKLLHKDVLHPQLANAKISDQNVNLKEDGVEEGAKRQRAETIWKAITLLQRLAYLCNGCEETKVVQEDFNTFYFATTGKEIVRDGNDSIYGNVMHYYYGQQMDNWLRISEELGDSIFQSEQEPLSEMIINSNDKDVSILTRCVINRTYIFPILFENGMYHPDRGDTTKKTVFWSMCEQLFAMANDINIDDSTKAIQMYAQMVYKTFEQIVGEPHSPSGDTTEKFKKFFQTSPVEVTDSFSNPFSGARADIVNINPFGGGLDDDGSDIDDGNSHSSGLFHDDDDDLFGSDISPNTHNSQKIADEQKEGNVKSKQVSVASAQHKDNSDTRLDTDQTETTTLFDSLSLESGINNAKQTPVEQNKIQTEESGTDQKQQKKSGTFENFKNGVKNGVKNFFGFRQK